MSGDEKPPSIAAALRAKRRRYRLVRRLGDAEVTASGAGVLLGDMTRSAGLEVAEVDEKDPRGTFEG